MSTLNDKWISNYKKNSRDINDLEDLGYSKNFLDLLLSRNLSDKQTIKSYLNPKLKDLYKPDLLPNIKKAADRIKRSIDNDEKVLIFGDYDTDGIISIAILYNFFKELHINTDYYIPDRFEEGYDINIDFLKNKDIENKYDLIICVDCGTNALDVQNYMKEGKLKIDIIVCDHHEPINTKGKNDNNFFIINPKLPGSNYPFKHLSGGGVTFKFIWFILKNIKTPICNPKEYLRGIIDLVAISTIADMMPLVDENRIIVKKGLEFIKNTKNKGLKKLLDEVLADTNKISTYDIGFLISPRLNAAGRMYNAVNSLKILLNDNRYEKINTMISSLNSFNKQRQKIQGALFKGITESYDFESIIDNERIFIASSQEWNEGVLGIVASNIVKRFNIPAILFREKEMVLKGSGRSIKEFNLYENLEAFRNYFIKFGGHSQACGITIKKEKYEDFKREFIRNTKTKIKLKDIEKKYYYDIKINFNDIVFKFIKELAMMEPFGIGNNRPIFYTDDCTINSDIVYSKDNKHAFFKIKNSNRVFDAVFFKFKDIKECAGKLHKKSRIEILYNIVKEENTYNSFSKIKLIIKNIR